MRPALLLAALLVLPACVAGGAIREEAEPFVEDAFETRSGLRAYLDASDTEVVSEYGLPHTYQPGVLRAFGFDFAMGGGCVVFTYSTANEALQLGPQNVGEYYVRSLPDGSAATLRQRFRPPIPFGRNVALCRGEDARVRNAFLGLRDYGEANDLGTEPLVLEEDEEADA
jgi:hypothetical protein